ncbi:ribulokinase [Candidatus Sumerlaeota bacterium]|nr:ribulokinase [Candidatus Sumerlaeota bacterium]
MNGKAARRRINRNNNILHHIQEGIVVSAYALGLDFGTNSVRALIVDAANGNEIATSVYNYRMGQAGVIIDAKDPNVARQHPREYVDGMTKAVKDALADAAKTSGFAPDKVIGIGVDTTGSTPIPVDESGQALALLPEYENEPALMAWLWKDHTSHAEAAEITKLAAKMRPQFLAKCGGIYSSEWFWAKILHCARTSPDLFEKIHSFVEHTDWMPAVLCGMKSAADIPRGVCAAGHKAMYNPSWGGYPDEKFLSKLDPRLARIRQTLPESCQSIAQAAGQLCPEWAERLGLPAGIAVGIGAFDAHLGGVGCGIGAGTLVKIMGTSTCDILVAPMDRDLPDVPGICGIVPESVLPEHYGLEAGQSAVGDIFNWYVHSIKPDHMDHASLTAGAENLKPGASGLLALDWNNGNRTILVDQRLTGLLMGTTLHTTPAEIFRALVEATAYGARAIIERFEEYGVKVERIVCCGGISAKNKMVMQIYADVANVPMEISSSAQTCALGSAICGAVAAGKANGGYDNYADAMAAMTSTLPERFEPIPENVAVYERLYQLYKRLHDLFGTKDYAANQYDVMKELLEIRDSARNA